MGITRFGRNVVNGVLAGAAGTVAMDALWYARYRRGGGEQDPFSWETAAGVEGWDKAPAPAQAAKKLADLAGVDVPDTRVRSVTNFMHWAYGSAWGALAGAIGGRGIRPGAALGLGVWGSSYVMLPALGVYKQVWEYDTETLWKDLSAHLVYGVVTGVVLEALAD
ncbi:MAG: hypothetical protein NVS3B24_09810 [Candidatus Dormibacteria bacterium]